MKNTTALLYVLFTACFIPASLKGQTLYSSEIEYIHKKGMNPTEYLTSKFNHYDLVLLGEDHGIKEHLDFVKKYTSKQWVTKEFAGKDHSENAWTGRLHIPLLFLISGK